MLGINLDPSHMMVLGADPIAAARALKGCIFHVHGKDLRWWKEFFSVCHMMGCDGDVSLEMEDLTMSVEVGVNTSIDALRQTISQ